LLFSSCLHIKLLVSSTLFLDIMFNEIILHVVSLRKRANISLSILCLIIH
jgi:hypothetical protein